jgi:hypothetical protein
VKARDEIVIVGPKIAENAYQPLQPRECIDFCHDLGKSAHPCGQCAMIENGLQKGRTRTELVVDREPSNSGGLGYRLQRETRNPSDLP